MGERQLRLDFEHAEQSVALPPPDMGWEAQPDEHLIRNLRVSADPRYNRLRRFLQQCDWDTQAAIAALLAWEAAHPRAPGVPPRDER